MSDETWVAFTPLLLHRNKKTVSTTETYHIPSIKKIQNPNIGNKTMVTLDTNYCPRGDISSEGPTPTSHKH